MTRRRANLWPLTVDGGDRIWYSETVMKRFTDEIEGLWPHTVRRLRVGRTSESRQASRFDLWYLTIAGVPAPRRKPAPGCVIHKTRPTGPDAGQHGGLPGGNLQPKGLSQGEQWRRRPNTSVRASLFLPPVSVCGKRAGQVSLFLSSSSPRQNCFGLCPKQPSTLAGYPQAMALPATSGRAPDGGNDSGNLRPCRKLPSSTQVQDWAGLRGRWIRRLPVQWSRRFTSKPSSGGKST